MSQSVKDQKDEGSRRTRPGQRQQERLMRLERRRRRQRLIISIVVFVLLVTVVGVGIWQYQLYQTKQTNLSHQHATATAKALITPTPSAGPATPPPVKGQTQTMAGGLQYIDVKTGTGATVQNGDTVNVQYTGWLQSTGKKFDSSYDHGGQPFSFTVGQGQVIKGFDEGLVGMKVGGTRRLIIPSSIGYGDQGSPPTIPGKATLIFDITLVSK
ncbi:MAG TPA: FKBP-type peptidyl-prolyl cis-trans isomerase [Ktedonobacteraceae bacterium]